MPITYSDNSRQFEEDGVVIAAATLRESIDKLTDRTRLEIRRISARFENGEINRETWAASVLALLTSAHIVAASVGKGGRERMTADDWGKVEKKIEWQTGYLEKWQRQIKTGAFIVAAGAIATRAASYVSAVYPSYANERFDERKDADKSMLCRLITHSKEGCDECAADEDLDWIPVDDMGEIGTRLCGDYCLCTIEFEDEVGASDNEG